MEFILNYGLSKTQNNIKYKHVINIGLGNGSVYRNILGGYIFLSTGNFALSLPTSTTPPPYIQQLLTLVQIYHYH